ncbi:O-antigen ligase family protein [Pelagibacterium lacus]|uniref:O-antigen ligase family protein n=1 Tax=Pelagibacterium lacus TaxID=2282655 RepID=UPI001314B500|nr:O-antigen ligase family protein [Pelagibacterium lacus]
MQARFFSFMRVLVLAIALPLVCLFGFYANYALLVLALVAGLGMIFARQRLEIGLAGGMFWAVFAGLGLTYGIAARAPGDLLLVFNLLPFALYPVLATLLGGAAARPEPARLLARLALAGVAVGAGLALVDGLVLGADRAGYIVSDPIRLSNTVLILAAFAVVLSPAEEGWRRWACFTAPVLALLVILLAGARTALLGYAPVFLIALFLVLPIRRALAVTLALAAALGLATAALFALDLVPERIAGLPRLLGALLAGEEIGDKSLAGRLELYRTGALLFRESPLWGHGWVHLADAIALHARPGYEDIARLPHLHNELVTFAATSGLIGVIAYGGLLVLPPLCAWRSPRDRYRRLRLHLALVLSAGYFFLGLADTMLIFELHMTLFVAWTAIILNTLRVPAAAPDD